MADISRIFSLVKIILFGITILFSLIYSLEILLNHRFHHRLNILTVNICLSMICSGTFYLGYFIMWEYDIKDLFTVKTCKFLYYLQTMSDFQLPFSLTVLTINRFCTIKYPGNRFFKTKIFLAICIASQWVVTCLISLPFIFDIKRYCGLYYWMGMYTFVIAVIVPSVITLILNLFIFKHVRDSSRRIHAQTNTTSMTVTMDQQPKINRRDISLLKHTIYIFGIFIIGWGPIFLLVAIDYNGNVVPLVYTLLELLSVISSLSCILDLFLYNHELRKYIKDKFLRC